MQFTYVKVLYDLLLSSNVSKYKCCSVHNQMHMIGYIVHVQVLVISYLIIRSSRAFDLLFILDAYDLLQDSRTGACD